jgi:hypothetical protein
MIHVYPIHDLEEHDTSDTGNTCKCNPDVIFENEEIIVIHNLFAETEPYQENERWYEEILKHKN